MKSEREKERFVNESLLPCTPAFRLLMCVRIGELAVRCDGPTQSANCQLVDNLDGTFTLDVTATEAGRHVLTIEYDGQHVAGRLDTKRAFISTNIKQ